MQSMVYRALGQFNPITIAFASGKLIIVNDVERSLTAVNLTTHVVTPLLEDMVGLKSVVSNDPAQRASECSINNGGCQHMCYTLPNKNTFNSRCGCADGYKLQSDQKTCQEPPTLYISMGAWIQRVHPFSIFANKTLDNVLYDGTADIVAVDYLWEKDTLVWMDGMKGRLCKTTLTSDSTFPVMRHSVIVNSGIFEPTDISADWISNVIYWSDKAADSINLVSLDGSLRRTIVEHAVQPTSLVVDPVLGRVFWIGWEPDTAIIRSSSLLGNDVATLISRLSTWPTDITLDYHSRRIYWVDASKSLVVSASSDGEDIKYTVGTHWMQYPVALAIWMDHTYWVDRHMSTVYVAEGSNANDVFSVQNKVHQVSDMALAHPEKQTGENECSHDNGGCSHVCIPPSSPAFSLTCLCPIRMTLKNDGKTCEALPQQVIGINSTPYLFSVGRASHQLSRQKLHNAAQIAVHFGNQAIYWIDNVKDAIEMVHVNGTGYRTVYKSTYTATAIKLDWMGGNIYWSESESRSIKCVTLNGRYDMIIAVTKGDPMFLLLDPPRSKLFWMECMSDGATLYESTLSGSDVAAVLKTTACPDSMDIARQTSSIYWRIGSTLHHYRYDMQREIPSTALPQDTMDIIWIEENLFVRSSGAPNLLYSIDRSVRVDIDVGNSTPLTPYSPLDTGYSGCSVGGGGCTHFCFHEADGISCGCPAQQELRTDDQKTCTSPRSVCAAEDWKCRSGECVSKDVLCDSHPDCIDGSDEAECGWCESSEFSCGLRCIPSYAVCDGVLDCEEGEDEEGSICSPCNQSGYTCKGTGLCIPSSMKCNGIKECLHGDDEKKCPKQEQECGSNEWRCSDGTCIYNTWVCDGAKECSDGGDEHEGCSTCTEEEFDCQDTTCLPLEEVCDGVIQCLSNGLDEMECAVCRAGQKMCQDGQCRAANRWCDRVPDCPDRSDERGCNYTIVDTTTQRQTHVAPTLIIIFSSLLMSLLVVCLLYKFNILPRIRSSYKQLTRSSNKTVETNVCLTTNTYSEMETTLCSSDWHPARSKSRDHYETMTTSSVSSMLKPINTQCNPYERLGILPVQSNTDVSLADGPAPSLASGGYSSGPGHSSRAPSARSRAAGSARSRATSTRSRGPLTYHVNNIWDDHINSISDYDQSCLSDNYLSESGYAPPRPSSESGYTPAHPLSESGYTPAHPLSESGYTPAHPLSESGYTPAHPLSESGYTPAHPLSESGYTPAHPLSESGYTPAHPLSESGYVPAHPLSESGYTPANPLSENGFEIMEMSPSRPCGSPMTSENEEDGEDSAD